MTTRLYTDDQIAELRSLPKRVTNPRAHWSDKPGHRQRNFQLTGLEGESRNFHIYMRQNQADEDDFSCGIAYLPIGGNRLTLARYNGPSHIHRDIRYRTHIHRATARAIAEGRKPESEADETNRYTTLDGAFRCLIEDFRVEGITPPPPDTLRLFHDS